MQGLGETAAMLSSLRKTREGALAAAVGRGAGALVETPRFGSNPGALRMLSYAPAGLSKGAPLVVLLHGCTQRAEGFAVAGGWLELADRCGFAILAPEQSSANNPNRCFNWFSPQDARRGQGEAASVRSMVAAAIRTHGCDPARVFVTGLSAGGAMTMVMLAAYPEVFAAGAVVAGLPYGGADNVSEAMMAMQGRFGDTGAVLGETLRSAAKRPARTPRLSIWHGDADAVVRSSNAAAIASQWAIAYGLAPEPDEVREPAGRRHAIWRSPATGEIVMEFHLLQGLGHGVPLATSGAEGLGSAAPYMIEHGVSSTWEIARFWGIAEPAEIEERVTEAMPVLRPAPPAPPARPAAPAAPHGLATDILDVVGRHVPVDVQAVIAKALKSAGLMK